MTIETTASGLQYEDVVVGDGAEAVPGGTVEVHYVGVEFVSGEMIAYGYEATGEASGLSWGTDPWEPLAASPAAPPAAAGGTTRATGSKAQWR